MCYPGNVTSEPVSFASDYRYIDSFEHPTHIGGKDLGNSENLEYLTKLKINVPSKAPVTHSRFWLRLITIRPDETYIDKSGCIGMVKTENSEIPTMFHDVPTVSLRLLYDS